MPDLVIGRERERVCFVGHSFRNKSEIISDLLLKTTSRPPKSFIDQLVAESGLTLEELPRAMMQKDDWKNGSQKDPCKLDAVSK